MRIGSSAETAAQHPRAAAAAAAAAAVVLVLGVVAARSIGVSAAPVGGGDHLAPPAACVLSSSAVAGAAAAFVMVGGGGNKNRRGGRGGGRSSSNTEPRRLAGLGATTRVEEDRLHLYPDEEKGTGQGMARPTAPGPTLSSWVGRASRGRIHSFGGQRALPILQASRSGSSDSCDSSSSTSSISTANKKSTKRRLYNFVEARKMARQYGFTTMQEYVEYECPGAYQLPKNPQEVYASEWKGWDDFLGLPWPYEQGRNLARALKVDTPEQYMKIWQSERVRNDPDLARLPYRPDKFYDDSCWTGWDDWLGTAAMNPN